MQVTNPDKVMFPEPGLTKADLVAHYERVGEVMLEFVARRPLTLQRFPNGVGAKGFMQKNAAAHFPASIERYRVATRDGGETNYSVVTRAPDIAYLANQGTITFHMWTSTIDSPDHPDWLVIDLDPEADDVAGARFATAEVGRLLGEFDLGGFPLATGSKGFHIWVPLDRHVEFDRVSLATRALAGLAAVRHPDRLTTEFLKKDRAGRVFVDWLRNTGIATVVAPFSVRPRANAPVAVPLRWDELEHARPDGWTITDLDERLAIDTAMTPHRLPADAIIAAAREAGVDLDTPHDRFGRRG